jgi:predicted alpha/beta-hydrolase family hydrolase
VLHETLILLAPEQALHRHIPGCRIGSDAGPKSATSKLSITATLREGRKRPDPLPKLIAAHREALNGARENDIPAKSTILIGKSMGGRVGCHLSLEEKVDGLVCLGYPLCAMGDRTKLRDEVLRGLNTPILFVQGSRDPLCPLDLLERARAEMKTQNVLHIVVGGDHSLRVPKRQLQANGQTQEDVDQQILKAIVGFVDRLPMTAD